MLHLAKMIGILAGSMTDPPFLAMLVFAVVAGITALPMWTIVIGAFACGIFRHYIALQNRALVGLDPNNFGYHLLAVTVIVLILIAVVARLISRRKERVIPPPY